MKLPKTDINLPVIHKDYAEYFSGAETIWNHCLVFINETDKFGAGKRHHFTHCLMGAYTKQMRLFFSAHRLCQEGLSQEAGIILRSMFDTYIHLVALAKAQDPDKFARLWLTWDLVRDSVCYEAIKKHNEEFPEFPTELAGIVSETKKELGKDWGDFKRFGPSGESFESLCGKVNMSGSYDTIYRITSKAVHSSDLTFYSRPLSEDGGILCQLSPESSSIKSIIPSMVMMLRDSVIIFHDKMNIGKQKEVDELKHLVETFIKNLPPSE